MRDEMKVLHVNAGNEYGGGLFHILSLFNGINQIEMDLLVFEEGPVAEMARKEGINVYVIPQKSRYDLTILSKLNSFIHQNQYMVVHTHGPRANLFVSLLKNKIKAHWVMTVHSDPTLDFKERGVKGRLFEKLNLRTLKKPDHLIAVSNEIRNILISNGVYSNRISVVHNGRAFSNAEAVTKPDRGHFSIITVGRLEWVKGHQYLLQALSEVKKTNLFLKICGTGQEEDRLKRLAEELGLSEKVDFLGWIDPEEVSEQIVQSDILVLPSLSESFPLVALEAGEKQVPVIATEVGDVREMIPNPTLGWLVPKENPNAIAEALEKAFIEWEKGLLEQKGERFYRWSRQFTIERQGLETLKVYQKSLEMK